MTSSNEWDPKTQASRPADITENIHRVIAWIYGAIGGLVLLVFLLAERPEWGATACITAFFAIIVGGILIYNAAQNRPPAHDGQAEHAAPDMRML